MKKYGNMKWMAAINVSFEAKLSRAEQKRKKQNHCCASFVVGYILHQSAESMLLACSLAFSQVKSMVHMMLQLCYE